MPRQIPPSCRFAQGLRSGGRDHYLGPHGTSESRERYDRLLAEWLVQRHTPPPAPVRPAITVVELLAAYLKFAESYYRRDGVPTSEYVAVRDALKPVRALYGTVFVTEFGPLALKACRETLIEKGLARRHINQG